MDISFKKIIAVCILALGAMNASATVISDLSERDWLTSGDGLLTFDASTGLEWLDLSVTLGNSIIDTEAMSFFGDFRWATTTQVDDLTSTTGLSGFDVSNDPQKIADSLALCQLMGPTGGTAPDCHLSAILSRAPLDERIFYSEVFVSIIDSEVKVDINEGLNNAPSFPFGGAGSWLVRDAAPSTIPEPGTLLLLTLGLAGLGVRLRQQKSL